MIKGMQWNVKKPFVNSDELRNNESLGFSGNVVFDGFNGGDGLAAIFGSSGGGSSLAYENALQEMAEAESQIAILMKRFEDALNAQKIASDALEAANGENRRLVAKALER
ncbi:hypothetical protein Fot_42171 [Forsythia ovata]|uniref:Uncharacterized protein n=1 Tax=Forsythia ovata TaxID=205694 RepID=A0ABD1RLE6_9LAMI